MRRKDMTNHIQIVSVKLIKERKLTKYIDPITRPRDAAIIMRDLIALKDREHFLVVGVDTKGYITHIEFAHIGTLSETSIHNREIYKSAILSNSKAIIIGHNHPSGDVSPSRSDLIVSERVESAGELLGIDVIDHIIVGDDTYYSTREKQIKSYEDKAR
jgi:DNA repair protein RadC